jgi:hypothetical protein
MVSDSDNAKDDEIGKIRSMAAKLRAEAAGLESDQAQAMAAAAERAFQKFDTNGDGKVTLAELKAGLEKQFKKELPENRVNQLMESFDKSGDGALTLDEFVNLNQFSNKLDALARDERTQALEKSKLAQQESEAYKLLQAQVEGINDKPPTGTDKLVSILPYLFPLLDGFQYARFFVEGNQDNPLAQASLIVYSLYRSIPFSGLIAFGALYYFKEKPGINRLVRFNMQQAIFLDIALFFPALFASLYQLTGLPLSVEAVTVSSDVLFITLLATVGYTMASSLLGITPDKIPFISDSVNNRVPTAEGIMTMGERFISQRSIESKADGESEPNGESLTKDETKETEEDKVKKD